MLGISTINSNGFRNLNRTKKAASSNCSVLSMRRCTGVKPRKEFNRKGKTPVAVDFNLKMKNAWFILALSVVFSGIVYLYQVNDLAAKGFELREVQKNLASLQEENKKGRIQEVELMSMYNIEKSTQDLNLVNSSNVSYIELNGPMAMR